MSETSQLSFHDPLTVVPGVGPQRAARFARLGIRTLADLLQHLPLRHERDLGTQAVEIASEHVGPVHRATARLEVSGEVLTTRTARGRRTRFEATLSDGTGTVLLTWFNQAWLAKKILPGMRIRVAGKAQRYGDYLQLLNPSWQMITAEDDTAARPREPGLMPVYPTVDGLKNDQILSAVDFTLKNLTEAVEDHLPETYRRSRELPPLGGAYRMIHRPLEPDEVTDARRRLTFDELLFLQLAVMFKRALREAAFTAIQLKWNEQLHVHMLERFPFPLTADQVQVIDEIRADLATTRPMNRLLQGDVGAGKTVVALYALLMAIASNHQGAFMAPTELLAEQHFATISAMLAGSKVRTALLTGSTSAKERREILDRLTAGEIDLLVGTHALLTETVAFRSLAVAVIDEQHRFGVHQRALLRAKSNEPTLLPHTLVMTATPIPRTLSLTVFGDLEVSTIRHLPPGRTPIITKHVSRAKRMDVYSYLADRIAQGEQAYIVAPMIEQSDGGQADVTTLQRALSDGPLHRARLAALHGRIPRDERERIMQAFRAGEIDALIATTVIEVGVDVLNATIMVIEDADRFGLSQLHQLRGRVGRGAKRSLCVLIAEPATEDGTARVEALVATNDGFAIAERDLEIRGPGELFGTKQSGLPPFQLAEFPRDLELLQMARRDAIEWIRRSPNLDEPDEQLLRQRMMKRYGRALGLGDVG